VHHHHRAAYDLPTADAVEQRVEGVEARQPRRTMSLLRDSIQEHRKEVA
jgi:hypothetical protein